MCGIRGGIGWNILSSLAQLFAFLAAILNLKPEETFEKCAVNQLITDGYRNWNHVIEMNRSFSKHATSKEHLACYSIWKEKSNCLRLLRKLPHWSTQRQLIEIATIFYFNLHGSFFDYSSIGIQRKN